jgi:hypothetical protein
MSGPRLGARKEENTRLPETSIDAAVLLFALFQMPAGQATFNLAIRLFVLFNDNYVNSIVG